MKSFRLLPVTTLFAVYKRTATFIIVSIGCLLCYNASAQDIKSDITEEKKVDYLEKIYFSGENKQGLNTKILVTLQEIQNGAPTPSLIKQLNYLVQIKEKADAADNACDILDMLAAGIYDIDAAEAVKQGVKMPTDKGKANAGDALAALSKLSNSTNQLSNTANNAAWSNYLLTGGRSTNFITGAGKVAGTANTITGVTNTVGAAANSVNQARSLIGGLGLGKGDKPCKTVAKKEIEIGDHSLAKTTQQEISKEPKKEDALYKTTLVSVKGIDYDKLKTFEESIKACAGVQTTTKKFNTTVSTIEVQHTGSTDELFTLMKKTAKDICVKNNIEAVEEGKIMLKL